MIPHSGQIGDAVCPPPRDVIPRHRAVHFAPVERESEITPAPTGIHGHVIVLAATKRRTLATPIGGD